MTAKEMFEKLQYECKVIDNFITYENKTGWISFNLKEKHHGHEDRQGISVEEHIAIHQQMKELGWIREKKYIVLDEQGIEKIVIDLETLFENKPSKQELDSMVEHYTKEVLK